MRKGTAWDEVQLPKKCKIKPLFLSLSGFFDYYAESVSMPVVVIVSCSDMYFIIHFSGN